MYVLGTEALNPLDAFDECVPPGIPENTFLTLMETSWFQVGPSQHKESGNTHSPTSNLWGEKKGWRLS